MRLYVIYDIKWYTHTWHIIHGILHNFIPYAFIKIFGSYEVGEISNRIQSWRANNNKEILKQKVPDKTNPYFV